MFSQERLGVPSAEVIACPVGDTLAGATTDGVPNPLVMPVRSGRLTIDAATTCSDPIPDVIAWPVGVTFAKPVTLTEPNPDVMDCPAGETSACATTLGAPSPDVIA